MTAAATVVGYAYLGACGLLLLFLLVGLTLEARRGRRDRRDLERLLRRHLRREAVAARMADLERQIEAEQLIRECGGRP